MGDDWDGHRGERDDDDQQIEAGPEESFGQSLRKGHDMDVFDELRCSKEGEVQNRDLYQGRKITPMGTERPLYTPARVGEALRTYPRVLAPTICCASEDGAGAVLPVQKKTFSRRPWSMDSGPCDHNDIIK